MQASFYYTQGFCIDINAHWVADLEKQNILEFDKLKIVST